MTFGRLTKFVLSNASRNRKQFILSAFGIVVGIASFVFFLALSTGVRNVVLGEMFPIERVEVVAPKTSFLGKDTSQKLTDETVEKIENQSSVNAVIPRMAISFPSKGHGWFDGKRFDFELVGDGVDPSYAEEKHQDMFKDWETPELTRDLVTCRVPTATQKACDGLYYCDARDNRCHHRVPIIVSRALLEIYNSQIAESRGMPVIGGFEEFIVDRGGLGKMRVYIGLGRTMVAGFNKRLNAPGRQVEGVILGLSDRAVGIGVTVPIAYVKRWNAEFLGPEAAKQYSSIIVELADKDDVGPFSAWIRNELSLELEDSMGEKFSWVILIITLLFIVISLVIVTISAINIAHNFFMQVSERRREIGVLRAVGARQSDIRAIFLGEAALIGLLAGVFGVLIAYLAAKGIDALAASQLPNFPFKPETFFDFQGWIVLGGLSFSIVFCVLGGLLPAARAAKMQPAQALAAQ